jgi:hypothetical protein
MTNCIIEWRALLSVFITPTVTWIVRKAMGRISPNRVEDFLEAIFIGISVLVILYLEDLMSGAKHPPASKGAKCLARCLFAMFHLSFRRLSVTPTRVFF